jgi:hypothetical protein
MRGKTGKQAVNKHHGEIFQEKIPDGKRKKCVLCSSFHEQFWKHEYNDAILIVKLDSVLKSALVNITPVLIMKNIIDTSS